MKASIIVEARTPGKPGLTERRPVPYAPPPIVKRLLVALGILAAAVAGFVLLVLSGLPRREEVRDLARRNPVRTSVMRQREEEAREAKRAPRHSQTWVPLSRISRHLIHAVVAAEDVNFFGHAGIDWDAVKQSVEADVRKGRFARGGSTITQQLAKNLFYTTRKSVTRKLREMIVARWLEEDLTKKRILELYLNVIEWGDGVYGCEAAAQRYYGRSAATLDELEAAGLAAMIPSPRRINPLAGPARFARAQKRVLWLMARVGYVERSVAGLGAEPPPAEEEEEESGAAAEEEPAQAEPDEAEPAQSPQTPSPEPTPPQPGVG